MGQHLTRERVAILTEIEGLVRNIDHIKQMIAAQQSIARSGGFSEPTVLADVMNQALHLSLSSKDRECMKIVHEYQELPFLVVDRHQLLQILVNLIQNAKQAMQVRSDISRCLTLRIGFSVDQEGDVCLQMSDTAMGIADEHLPRLFHQGFTTQKTGHGFGLHHASLSAKHMKGSLNLRSDGAGRGATFTLVLPTKIEMGSA